MKQFSSLCGSLFCFVLTGFHGDRCQFQATIFQSSSGMYCFVSSTWQLIRELLWNVGS